MKYLIDSDIVISYLKGVDEITHFLQRNQENLHLSVISYAEILEGIIGQPHEQKLNKDFQNFISGVNIIDIDNKIAREFASARAQLRKKGKLIDNFDLLIAATAMTHSLTLVTGNIKHFRRLSKLKSLNPLTVLQ